MSQINRNRISLFGSVVKKCVKWIRSLVVAGVHNVLYNESQAKATTAVTTTADSGPAICCSEEVTSSHSFSVKTGPNPYHSSRFNTTKLKLESSVELVEVT